MKTILQIMGYVFLYLFLALAFLLVWAFIFKRILIPIFDLI